MSSSKVPEIYDIVCVGGGPAGLGLLTALGRSNSVCDDGWLSDIARNI